MAELLSMELANAPRTEEVTEALEAYVAADKACDKAHHAWQIAQQRLKARREALERAIEMADDVAARLRRARGEAAGASGLRLAAALEGVLALTKDTEGKDLPPSALVNVGAIWGAISHGLGTEEE